MASTNINHYKHRCYSGIEELIIKLGAVFGET